MMQPKTSANLLHYYVLKQVFSLRAKTLIFDALLRGKAGFLMTHKKVHIWCIITWKSRFSHDTNENKMHI